MKTTTEPMFSNATEHMTWVDTNCDGCIKQSRYNEKTDEYTNFRCSIDRDIAAQICGLNEVSVKNYNIVQEAICPFKKTERSVTKRRKIKGQIEIELFK